MPIVTVVLDPEIGFKSAVEAFQKRLIYDAYKECGWNKMQIARKLKMNRTTLIMKLKLWDADCPEYWDNQFSWNGDLSEEF